MSRIRRNASVSSSAFAEDCSRVRVRASCRPDGRPPAATPWESSDALDDHKHAPDEGPLYRRHGLGHLFGPMPPEMRDDTALMDRIHCYLPGWDVPKISEALKTDHFGAVSDFLSECWSRLRSHNRVAILQGRLTYGGALSGRDQNAANKTLSGLLKLIHPSPEEPVPEPDLEWAVRLALEC